MEELIRILFKWFKPITLVVGFAIVGSATVSFLLPEQFTTTATFLTTSPLLMDRTHLFSVDAGKKLIYPFGGKGDINRILTLGESGGLKMHMINKFNLYENYDIDVNDPQKEYWVTEAFDDHIKLVKTAKGMIQVMVTDKDPKVAAEMANEITRKLDEFNKNIINEKKRDQVKLYKQEFAQKEREVKTLKDSLNNLINTNAKDTVTANLVAELLKKTMEEYITIQTIQEQEEAIIGQSYSSLYLIEAATPPVKRSKPVRWLIVVSTTLITLFAMMIIAVFSEKIKEWKLEYASSS